MNAIEYTQIMSGVLAVYFSINAVLNAIKILAFREDKLKQSEAAINVVVNVLIVILLGYISEIANLPMEDSLIFKDLMLWSIVVIPGISYFILRKYFKDSLDEMSPTK